MTVRHFINIFRLGVKELRSLAHDRVLIVLIIWVFSGGIYVATTATSQELHNAPIAVVDEDQSKLSERIISAFYGPYFKPPVMISQAEIDPSLDSGAYTFVLNVPPNFEHDLVAGKHPELQVNIDATRMTQAFIGAGYIQNIINGEVAEFLKGYRGDIALPIKLATHVKFNPNLTSSWFGSIMELINNVTLLSIILTGAALIREREHGTLEHLLVMPLNAAEIVLSKIWSMGLIVLLAAWLSLHFVVQGALHVPVAGSITLFMCGALLHLLATTSIGVFLGTVARNMPQLGLLLILTILPLQILSGGVTPRESMPLIVQNIMLVAPTTHFVSLAQAILYRGAGFDVVWPSFLAIIAIGAVFFALSLALFRQSLARTQ
jgi:ABC-2 type transport system permease protein